MHACVLTVLHDNELTHTDLKPENILFVNSEADIIYNPQKVGFTTAVGDCVVWYLVALIRAFVMFDH